MGKITGLVIDYWPFAEDEEKWGVEIYEDNGDDPTDTVWFRDESDAVSFFEDLKTKR